jgi:hypothetical protein
LYFGKQILEAQGGDNNHLPTASKIFSIFQMSQVPEVLETL